MQQSQRFALHFAHFRRSLNNLTASERDEIVENWGQKNEEQLQRTLMLLKPFLLSPIVSRSYLLFESEINNKFSKVLQNLADALDLNKVMALDESADLRSKNIMSNFSDIVKANLLDTSLLTLKETILLYLSHNMIVESGFSKMKFHESDYQPGMRNQLYDAIRFVNDNIQRDVLENFVNELNIEMNKSSIRSHQSEKQKLKNERHAQINRIELKERKEFLKRFQMGNAGELKKWIEKWPILRKNLRKRSSENGSC